MFKKFGIAAATLLLLVVLAGCGGDPYETSIYSEQPEIVTFQDYLEINSDLPSEGIDPIMTVGAEKGVITKHGLEFKDSDGDGELDDYEDWRLTPEERAADLASQMTWEQKLGLLSWGNQRWTGGPSSSPSGTMWYGVKGLESNGMITEDSAANSILNNGLRYSNLGYNLDPVEEATFLNNIQGMVERAQWGIPFFWCGEVHFEYTDEAEYDMDNPPAGKLMPWPFPLGLGAADDLSITYQYGNYIRQELRMRGRHATWGPVADLATEPRWSRVSETIHAQGDVVASHIEVLIKAMQASDEDKNEIGLDGVITYVKHFPGMGPNEEGMDSHTYPGRYNSYPGDNFDEHLEPFRAAIEGAHAGGVMMGYSIVDTGDYGPMAAAYSPAVYELLYSLGFDGDITTDNNPGAWGVDNYDELTLAEKAAMTLEAGANHWLGGDFLADWKEADEAGLLSEEAVNRAAEEALQLQFRLGLFENPYVDLAEAQDFWDPQQSQMQDRVAAGKQAMASAMVLVKNAQFEGADVLPVIQRNAAVFDTNGNGVIDVYFDSEFDGYDSGEPNSFATSERYPNRNFVSDIADADVAIVRIFSRGGIYFGTEGAVPLSFDGLTHKWDHEAGVYTDEVVQEMSLNGGGNFRTEPYRVLGGSLQEKARLERILAAKAANPNLKVVVGLTAARPLIVEPYLDQIDAMFVDFGATDDVFTNMVFNHEGMKPVASLPIEFPSSDESAAAQLEDVPGDSENPTFRIGLGLAYASTGY